MDLVHDPLHEGGLGASVGRHVIGVSGGQTVFQRGVVYSSLRVGDEGVAHQPFLAAAPAIQRHDMQVEARPLQEEPVAHAGFDQRVALFGKSCKVG